MLPCGHGRTRATRPSIDFCMPLKQQLLPSAGRLHRCSNSRPLIQHCASCSSPRVAFSSRRHDGDAVPKLLCFLLQLNNDSQNSSPHQLRHSIPLPPTDQSLMTLIIQPSRQSSIQSISVPSSMLQTRMQTITPLVWLVIACFISFFAIVGTIYLIAHRRRMQRQKQMQLQQNDAVFRPMLLNPLQTPPKVMADRPAVVEYYAPPAPPPAPPAPMAPPAPPARPLRSPSPVRLPIVREV